MVDAPAEVPDAPSPRSRRGRLVAWAICAILAACVVWAVEAGSPERIDATGVDELVVPWPDPDPQDFVDGIDHPWLPLRPGASWVHAGQVDGVATTRTTTVLDETREVAGIEATVVRVQQRTTGGPGSESLRFYAQDRRGHVWLLGEEGVWEVGPGVPAGLALAAEPRRGDAAVRVPLSGDGREVVRVGERNGEARTPAGDYSGLLQLTETRGTPAGEETQVWLARGVGEVLRTVGADDRLELQRHEPGS